MKKMRWDGKTIEVAGILYKIKYRANLKKELEQDTPVTGIIDYHTRTIILDKTLSNSEQIVVLVHELCHAVLDSFIPAEVIDNIGSNTEEMIIDPFARILVGALRSAGLLKE